MSMSVYVRWYDKVVQGELLDGEFLGMKQVRIPLDGRNPIALFMPWSVYESADQISENRAEINENRAEINENRAENANSDVLSADNRKLIEAFKRDNWNHERGHLRTDKLDEFYRLWRKVTAPFGYVEAKPAEAPAPTRIVSDERIEELKQQLKEKFDKLPEPHPAPKPARQKPSKKMLHSTGQQVFQDSTQLSLFD